LKRRTAGFAIVALSLGLISPWLSNAEDVSPIELGINTGVTAIKHDENFNSFEVFWRGRLPWNSQWPSGWILNSCLSINAGVLSSAHDEGFICSIGPSFTFKKPDSRFILSLGFRLALMNDYEFGEEELGGVFAFIEEAGISYYLGWNLIIGYQFRHMSNAGIYKHNPGLDLHVFELRYNF